MYGICFQGVGVVRFEELTEPILEADTDAIVGVEIAGMCGSDMHPFLGREVGLDRGTVMGHEFVGKVLAVGSQVHKVRVGDRVYTPFSTSCGDCFYCSRGLSSRCTQNQLFGWRSQGRGLHGGQAERVRVPLADGTLVKVPTGMSAEMALLLGDNLSTGFYCAEMAQLDPNGVTVIIGCGTVGLLSLQAAKRLGTRRILAIDKVASRRARAEAQGVTALPPGAEAMEWVRQETEGRGADSVMELVGLSEAQQLAYDLLRPGGTLSVIGCHTSEHFAFSPVQAYDKNLTYRTGRCPARAYMERLSPMLLDEAKQFEQWVTHRFQPEDCERAYEIFSQQQEGCIKAVIEFA